MATVHDEIEDAKPGSTGHLRLMVEAAMPAMDMLVLGILGNERLRGGSEAVVETCREWMQAAWDIGIKDRSKWGKQPEAYSWMPARERDTD